MFLRSLVLPSGDRELIAQPERDRVSLLATSHNLEVSREWMGSFRRGQRNRN